MYTLGEISVIIPTYNRPYDLEITLNQIRKYGDKVKEVIIVDQSKNDSTKELVKGLGWKKVLYVYSKVPSITIARNLGIKRSSSHTKIICFLDDDVSLEKGYFENILRVFNSEKSALAVAAYDNTSINETKFSFLLKKIFFLGRREKQRAEIISAYGNIYPEELSEVINSQWLPGVNMCFKKEVFNEQKFDENLLGYTVAEDIGFTYRLYKSHQKSLFITPFAKLRHRVSNTERAATKKISYINQVDHFYFFFKNLGSTRQTLIFIWSLLGISLLRILSTIFKPNKTNLLKSYYFFSSLLYCLSHIRKIHAGELRDFL